MSTTERVAAFGLQIDGLGVGRYLTTPENRSLSSASASIIQRRWDLTVPTSPSTSVVRGPSSNPPERGQFLRAAASVTRLT